ncbi:MAG: ABC transporter transmembrane domain-containing protein [Alphaproteobacteria bacterium]|nr:ABC transporter transmembrane domain-containing protein [Alphaproteobacteria bacterium]
MGQPHQNFAHELWRIPTPATLSIVLASFLSNTLATALPIAILITYDRVLPNASGDTLVLMAVGVAGAILIDVIARIARGAIVGHRAARYGHRAYLGGISQTLAADPRVFQATSTATHLDRLSAIDTIRESRGGHLPQLMVDFPFFIVFVGLVFAIGGALGWLLLGFIAATGVCAIAAGLFVRTRMEARQANASAQTNFLFEVLGGLLTIKSYAMETLMQRRFERVMESSAGATTALVRQSISAQAVINLISQGAQISIVAAGSLFVMKGEMTIGGIAACMLLTGRALQPLNRAAMLWSQYQSVRIAKQRVEELRSLPLISPIGSLTGDGEIGITKERLLGQITLKNVTFSYDGTRDVLSNLSLSIARGETVRLTSDGNWSGKSTLLALMGRVLAPGSGVIEFDDMEAEAYDDEWLRSRIAYLTLNPALFNGSIMQNLIGFNPTPERIQSVEEISEELGLTEVVSKLPRGFRTEIQLGNSASLPASIRQQIPIVRALARDPAIILMDECNANLDRIADEAFRAALRSRKSSATIVMITPRPSFQALADREILLGSMPTSSDGPVDLDLQANTGTPELKLERQ